MGVAARYEKYSDFGSTRTGKVSARYEFNPMFALRATANTGGVPRPQPWADRPPLHPEHLERQRDVRQPYLPGRPSGCALLLGAQDLKPEKSTNFSLGAVFTPLPNASLTVDVYQISCVTASPCPRTRPTWAVSSTLWAMT